MLTDQLGRAAAGLAAFALIAVVYQEAFEVMLLPRRMSRRQRFVSLFFSGAWLLWRGLGRRFTELERREQFLSVFGPLSLVVLLALWAVALIVGFGTLEWSLEGGAGNAAWSEQVYMSGVTFFTLGYGDIVPKAGWSRFVAVFEAGSGLGFIAIVIGYLPVLYQLFSSREAHVIQLDARAGSPPTALELLARHGDAVGLQKLDDLLRDWEIWASELLESHLSYPMLAYYRSQHASQSWLAALTTVADACAIILVGAQKLHPLQARMTLAMARLVMVQLADAFGTKPSRFQGMSRLDHDGYLKLDTALGALDMGWQGGEAAEENLALLRATYEPLVDGLASALLLPVPEIVSVEKSTDHWERGHRGLIFGKLLKELSEQSLPTPRPTTQGQSGWRRIRRRFK